MLEIYSFASNRPDLLEPQLRSFQRHLLEPFVFRVVNNGFWNDRDAYVAIESECKRLGIETIGVPKDLTRAAHLGYIFSESTGFYTSVGASCGYSVDTIWVEVICQSKGKVLLCHHDMFLVEDTILSEFIKEKPLAFIPQDRPPHIDLSKGESECYLWEGFVLADIPRLPEPSAVQVRSIMASSIRVYPTKGMDIHDTAAWLYRQVTPEPPGGYKTVRQLQRERGVKESTKKSKGSTTKKVPTYHCGICGDAPIVFIAPIQAIRV